MRFRSQLARVLIRRLVPRRYRFPIAATATRLLLPHLRRTSLFSRDYIAEFFSDFDIALDGTLGSFDQFGVTFDPPMTITGGETLTNAYRENRPVLIVSLHGGLSRLVGRGMADLGIQFAVVAAGPTFHIPGLAQVAPIIPSDRMMLLHLRRALLDGRCVGMMIDWFPNDTRRVIDIETMGTRLRMTDAPIEVALRCEARVVFALAGTDIDGKVQLSFVESSARTSRGILTEFARQIEIWNHELGGGGDLRDIRRLRSNRSPRTSAGSRAPLPPG